MVLHRQTQKGTRLNQSLSQKLQRKGRELLSRTTQGIRKNPRLVDHGWRHLRIFRNPSSKEFPPWPRARTSLVPPRPSIHDYRKKRNGSYAS